MTRRTAIEIDEELLERAREILGETAMRATVEDALRRVADSIDPAHRAENQRRYLQRLAERVDASVLASEEMWR